MNEIGEESRIDGTWGLQYSNRLIAPAISTLYIEMATETAHHSLSTVHRNCRSPFNTYTTDYMDIKNRYNRWRVCVFSNLLTFHA